MSDRVLVDQQLDIVGRLLSDDYFADINVLCERVADLDYEVAASLGIEIGRAGKVGAMVLVQQPVASDEHANMTFGPLSVDWTILVMEHVAINMDAGQGTRKPALEIARRVCRVMKHYSSGGLSRLFVLSTPAIVPAQAIVSGRDDVPVAPVCYSVRLTSAEADSETFTKVQAPSISASGSVSPATATLACSTSGASIYYTIDGTYPRSGNGTLYSSPITIASACMLRAAAYKTGSIPSNVTAADFT